MKRGHGFMVLVWLMMIGGEVLAAVPVPPPTDVKVTCQNLKVQVRWHYSRAHTQSSFHVSLKRNNRCFVKILTVAHQYDLTHHIWSSEDVYMSIFHVMVTATVGGNQSEPASSHTFTFNNVKTAANTCRWDFPPAELVRKDLDATLSFSNPFHFYRELKQAGKSDTATFEITITSDDGSEEFSCSAKEETCKHDIVIPERKKYCVTLNGVFFAGDHISQISFRKSDRICAVAAANFIGIVIGVLLGIIILAVVLIVAIIVAKHLNAPVVFPSATRWPIFGVLASRYATVSPEDMCIVHPTPRKTEPSLNSSSGCQESEASVCTEDGSSDQELAYSGGLLSGDEDAESEPAPSGYDSPHFVDMGSGDIVTAYN